MEMVSQVSFRWPGYPLWVQNLGIDVVLTYQILSMKQKGFKHDQSDAGASETDAVSEYSKDSSK